MTTPILNNLKTAIFGARMSGLRDAGRLLMQIMNGPDETKYGDRDGNVYGVEKASNGNWVVIRTNSGGNRKAYRHIATSGSRAVVQRLLDDAAKTCGWTEVPK